MEEIIIEIIGDILDMDLGEISPESYLIRDLGAESIDLMELAVTLNDRLGIEVVEEDIFLGRLREHLMDAQHQGQDPLAVLSEKYPFLSSRRIDHILTDLDQGPVLKVKDLVDYVRFYKN